MPGVVVVETEAHGGQIEPLGVMNHIMQGYKRTMEGWARERPDTTPKSAQFLIGRDGDIVQTVSIFEQAWAGGTIRKPKSKIIKELGGNPNNYFVHIEHEGFSTPPGYGFDYIYSKKYPWSVPMIESSIRVHAFIIREVARVQNRVIDPNRDTVIGHRQGDSVNRANDPSSVPRFFGEGVWPQKRIIHALRQQLVVVSWTEDRGVLRTTLLRMLRGAWMVRGNPRRLRMKDDAEVIQDIMKRYDEIR